MNILIDGYNLLKQLLGGQITDRQRKGFAERAAEYAIERGIPCISSMMEGLITE